MANKMMKCKTCGTEIAKSAKVCPNCGAKNKKPIFTKWWFWVLVVFILIAIAGGSGNKDNASDGASAANVTTAAAANNAKVAETTAAETTTVETTEAPLVIDAQTLVDEFDANEIKANQLYKGKVAEITGVVNDIGEVLGMTYITINDGDQMHFLAAQCFFKDKTEIAKIAELSKGDTVTVIGTIEGKSLNIEVKNCIFK